MFKRLKYVVVLILCFAALASGSVFTSVVVFGDSLSDNGNLFRASVLPAPPYWQGRSSNGPVAVENLAQSLNAGLIDLAWSGATTGIGNHLDGGNPVSIGTFGLPGMQLEYLGSKGSVPTGANTLFVVWGGADDLLSPAPQDGSPAAVLQRSIGDIDSIVKGLLHDGAQHILVPGMPDLGLTPYFSSTIGAAAGTSLTEYFNFFLQVDLAQYGSAIRYFDTSGFLHRVVANPGAYGFTNVTDMCYDGVTVCAHPDQYLFWDDLHPTARGHAILGDAFANAIPEPGSLVLTGLGLLLGMGAIRRRGRAQ